MTLAKQVNPTKGLTAVEVQTYENGQPLRRAPDLDAKRQKLHSRFDSAN